jgi:predicted dinucleotide-binding enzyme
MKIGILGTGMVGATIGKKLVDNGHSVYMGAREANNPKAIEWQQSAGENAHIGTFTDAAAFGELIFNCTAGRGSVAAVRQAGVENLAGKILIDVANPLDFSNGMPPFLIPEYANTNSLAESLQNTLPNTYVVKGLSTVNCKLMVDATLVAGEHSLLICGDNADAKEKVTALLKTEFGWQSVLDLGGISAARAIEGYLPLWVQLYSKLQTANFNIAVVK